MLISVKSLAKTAILGGVIGAAVVVLPAAWQVSSSELANIELQDDMRDMASQISTRIGFSSSKSDDDLRSAVLKKADRYDISLNPDQITIQHDGSGDKTVVYIAADYSVPIRLPGFEFTLRFTPSSAS